LEHRLVAKDEAYRALERELAQARALIEQQSPRGGNGSRPKRR
jgi:hypothetical protein